MDGKKTICLIIPGKLPVPNIMGGAIETLVTLLIDQNEVQKKVNFIVVSAWVEGIEKVSSKYKNTKFYYFKIRSSFYKKVINFINYIIAKTTGVIDFFRTPMHSDIESIMNDISADVVIVEQGVYKHFDFLLKKYSKNQLYLHIHGTGPMPDRRTRKTFGNVITVSEFVRKLYEPGYVNENVKFKVVTNGIDASKFEREFTIAERNEIRMNFNISEDDLLVIYVGRLVKEKGIKEVIKGIIDCKNDKIKLMIIGSSNFKDEKLTSYVMELKKLICGYEKQIFFTGYIPNEDLYKYYKSADLHVVCSIYEEAAGLVAIEGQLCGLPLLVTNSGGLNEFIVSKDVHVIDKRNALYSSKDSELLSCDICSEIAYYYQTRKCHKYNSEPSELRDKLINEFDASKFYQRFLNVID